MQVEQTVNPRITDSAPFDSDVYDVQIVWKNERGQGSYGNGHTQFEAFVNVRRNWWPNFGAGIPTEMTIYRRTAHGVWEEGFRYPKSLVPTRCIVCEGEGSMPPDGEEMCQVCLGTCLTVTSA